jgi:hypothetical protein
MIVFVLYPALAFLFVAVLPRRLGLLAALLGAGLLALTVWKYHAPRPPDPSGSDAMGNAIASGFRWLLPALTWGMATVAGLAQLVRPKLEALGWAAYPGGACVIFTLSGYAMLPLTEWLL